MIFERQSFGRAAQRILYYRDPMHPSYKSDKPGIAPDCGMELVPVYGAEAPGGAADVGIPVSPEQLQLMGVVTGEVQRSPISHTIRTVGQAAADETRIVRMVAGMEGWVREISPKATGALVREGDLLAIAYSRDFATAQQSYLYALKNRETAAKDGRAGPGDALQIPVDNSFNGLRLMGASEAQIRALERTRQAKKNIEFTAPITGFVMASNFATGLRFEPGAELMRLADLRRVWILADLFQNEAAFLKPGQAARITFADGAPMHARVSETLPQFDPASRTMKVRLEADNPAYRLQPGMLVDVEFPVSLPVSIHIPADALVDSGVRKTVFVDRGGGRFEPRSVETGWRFGDRVEIVKGLSPGERIALSGAFLLDSETRMRR